MEVVRRILDLTGASPDLVRHVADRPGHDRRYAVDSSKLRALGWTPQHSFDAGGLEETVEWYRENRDWWEPIKSGDYRRYYDEQYAARLGGADRRSLAAARTRRVVRYLDPDAALRPPHGDHVPAPRRGNGVRPARGRPGPERDAPRPGPLTPTMPVPDHPAAHDGHDHEPVRRPCSCSTATATATASG